MMAMISSLLDFLVMDAGECQVRMALLPWQSLISF